MNKTPRIVPVENKKSNYGFEKMQKTRHALQNDHALPLKMAKFVIFMLKTAKMGARS